MIGNHVVYVSEYICFFSNLSTARNFEFGRLANLSNSKLRAVDRLERNIYIDSDKQRHYLLFEFFRKHDFIQSCSFLHKWNLSFHVSTTFIIWSYLRSKISASFCKPWKVKHFLNFGAKNGQNQRFTFISKIHFKHMFV